MEPHYYNVNLDWDSEREGNLSSPELNDEIKVATPLPFTNGIEGVWSPEHLLTASVSSCYMTTFLAIAENSKLEFETFSCEAKGKLEQIEGKYLMTEIELFPRLKIKNELDNEKAMKILLKTEKACLISNSIQMKVSLNPTIL
jgi:peroxiredoxin-like protein